MVTVKICGITNVEDALLACRYGADAVGLLVNVDAPTPRKIPMDRAKEIITKLPYSVVSVVVTTPRNAFDLKHIENELTPNAIQIHSYFDPNFLDKIKTTTIKTIHVDRNALHEVKIFEDYFDCLLLDTKTNLLGGSGVLNDLDKCSEIVKNTKKPVFLSGGLTPENVGDAIRKVRPFGVDVSSGVELKPGKKDPDKLKKFIKVAKDA